MLDLPGNKTQLVAKSIKSYEDLIVWQKADELAFCIYLVTQKFPKNELYVLVAQMRRAAISIPSNIAEGFARQTKKDFSNFLVMALGSLNELRYQVKFSTRLGYLSKPEGESLVMKTDEVGRMLRALMMSVRRSNHA